VKPMESIDRTKRVKRWSLIGATFLIALWMNTGCQGVQSTVKQSEMNLESPSSPPKVTLGPGDGIDFKFFYNPELNDTQTIRPDGKIVLQLVGEVTAQGKTPAELQDDLKRLYAPQLKNPEIAVIVRSQVDRRIYVGGEVKKPGLIPLPGRLTALEAIMEAGGFDPRTACASNVVLIRHKDGKRYGATINFDEALDGKGGNPVYLEPNDIVYVPRTTIAKVNQWIDQYINKIVPRTGLSLLYPLGAGAIGLDTSTTVFVP
jgi:protein involved in polysaccharide export with SLBB domain